jgi:hypothetical protein
VDSGQNSTQPRITEFRFIKTDLPDSDHLPPRRTYGRPEGSKVPISALATAEMSAYVERSEFNFLAAPVIERSGLFAGLENATLTESLNVSLEGTVKDGKITDFTVTAVEPSKP